MPRRFALIAVYAAVVLTVIGGTAAYALLGKSVTLRVDGNATHVRTFAGSVSGVLDARDISLHKHDRVSSALSTPVDNDDTITVKHARPLTLTLDGVTTHEWAFDTTVQEVLERVGVAGTAGTYVSADASASIPRDGMSLVVSTPKPVTVKVDGKVDELTTAAPTVRAVLAEADVTVDSDDETEPALSAPVVADQGIQVVRIATETKTETVPIDFETKVEDDASLFKGDTKIVTPGADGKKREKVTITTADGKVRDRTVLETDVIDDPVTQVEQHGTKDLPSVWDRLAKCESGGNWKTNTGNGFYGGLQFSAGTWRSMGGTGLPSDNSREEQIKRGIILQKRAGWGQWPACSKKLGLR